MRREQPTPSRTAAIKGGGVARADFNGPAPAALSAAHRLTHSRLRALTSPRDPSGLGLRRAGPAARCERRVRPPCSRPHSRWRTPRAASLRHRSPTGPAPRDLEVQIGARSIIRSHVAGAGWVEHRTAMPAGEGIWIDRAGQLLPSPPPPRRSSFAGRSRGTCAATRPGSSRPAFPSGGWSDGSRLRQVGAADPDRPRRYRTALAH